MILRLAALATVVAAPLLAQTPDSVPAEPRWAPTAAALERLVRHEMADKRLPALSIALVDDQRVVWAKGFGIARPAPAGRDSAAATPATARTVYRVGSVSKLFTDLGIMRLVEQGKLDLDAPVTRYLPDFRPRNPFGTAITLRMLMSHRAGLVREPPAGNYFDSTESSLARTVASLNATTLVYAPGTHTKYSNAGIAVVGRVLEVASGEPFVAHLRRAVLGPLGMSASSFAPTEAVSRELATAYMWGYDDRRFEAPTFQLGMAPAGSMYSTVGDLGRFLSALFAGARAADGTPVVRETTLRGMWTPQFVAAGTRGGFGLGFMLDELAGHRRVSHGGAIYGFATEIAGLPDDKLGVVVATTLDGANAVTNHVADVALRSMLAARTGAALPAVAATSALDSAVAARLAGGWGTAERAVRLDEWHGTLSLTAARGGFTTPLRRLGGDTLIVDGALAYGPTLIPAPGILVVGHDSLARSAPSFEPTRAPSNVPARWRGLVGEYGWDYETLYIREQGGKLHALIEWFFDYPLDEVAPNVFRFPAWGLYEGESLVFRRDAGGRATQVVAANVRFARRNIEPAAGTNQLRVTPVRPVAELRAEALRASPPVEQGSFRAPDLVEPTALDGTIHLEIRYATTNNFLGTRFYDQARAFLQRPAAEAVVRVNRALRPLGYGLLIHDAYRPWYVTKMFWDATPPEKHWLVADPSQGSRHNRGAAVDLTLYDLKTGRPVEMVSTYDESTERAFPRYPGGTSLQRWHRELLRRAMEAEGFTVYALEWWHFDYNGWREYPIGNATFDRIADRGSR